MHWVFLSLAIGLEVAGTTCMKLSFGLTRVVPSVLLFLFYGLSFACMSLALKRLDVSYAYAVWSAAGTALIAVIGVLWFNENVNAVKVVSLALIIVGVVGLHISEGVR